MGKIYIEKTYNKITCIKNVLAYIGNVSIKNTYNKDVYIKKTYIKVFCINNIWIDSIDIVKYLKIYI